MTWSLFPKDPTADLTEDDRYVITYTARPPMRDAGIKRKTPPIKGRASVRATAEAIRGEHARVLQVRKVNWLGW